LKSKRFYMKQYLIPVLLSMSIITSNQNLFAETIEYESGMNYGTGYDSQKGELKGVVVESKPLGYIDGAENGGSRSEFILDLIEDTNTLSKALGIDARASAGFGPFKASAKVNSLKKLEVNSYYSYVLVRYILHKNGKQLLDPKLTDLSKTIVNSQNFSKTYGNKFIKEIDFGAEYYGLAVIKTHSSQEKDELKARLKASGWGVNGSGNIDKASLALTTSSETSIHRDVIGGPINDTLPADVSEMLKQAINFPKTLDLKALTPYTVALVNIQTIPGAPSNIKTALSEQLMNDLATRYNLYRDYVNDINYVASHPDEFQPFEQAYLEQVAEPIIRATNITFAQIEGVDAGVLTSVALPVVLKRPILPERLPEESITINALPNEWQSPFTLKRGESAIIRYIDGQWSLDVEYPTWGHEPVSAEGYTNAGEAGTSHAALPMPTENFGALIANVGGNLIKIGMGKTIGPVKADTTVSFKVNDTTYKDNFGYITIGVAKRRPKIEGSTFKISSSPNSHTIRIKK
jgi:hypothetical protein